VHLGVAATQNAIIIENIKIHHPLGRINDIIMQPEATAELFGISCFHLINTDKSY
jgi:hypothetical protein